MSMTVSVRYVTYAGSRMNTISFAYEAHREVLYKVTGINSTSNEARFKELMQSNEPSVIPGWKICQLRTKCQETDKILRTKNENNVRTKIKIEIARDGPIPIFMIMFYNLISCSASSHSVGQILISGSSQL